MELALVKRILRAGKYFFHAIGALTIIVGALVCVPARFAREGETVHRCRKSGRFDESEGELEVS